MQTPLQWPHLLPLAQARDVSRKLIKLDLLSDLASVVLEALLDFLTL